MLKLFDDVLKIKNGKNQKAVETPYGKYPIYGSGGVMGYADNYICKANTVVIGRKGSINNPLFVEEPFWNVDTAFGLEANTSILNPRFLYYFCRNFDFKRLNKTVTIPSLTKSDLLQVRIDVPEIPVQGRIVNRLQSIERIISLMEKQLEELDGLSKSRFIEMFKNGKYPIVRADNLCEFITKGTTPASNEIIDRPFDNCIPYLKVYNLSFDGRMLFFQNPQYISRAVHEGKLARSKVYPNDVLMNIVGPPLGKFSLVNSDFPEWNINQAIAIFRAKEKVLPKFLLHALMQPDVLKPFLEKAQGVRQLNFSLEQCRNLKFPLPPLDEQAEFVQFAEQTDKSKMHNRLHHNLACKNAHYSGTNLNIDI